MITPYQKSHLPSALHYLQVQGSTWDCRNLHYQRQMLSQVFLRKQECMGLHSSCIQSCFIQSAHSNQIWSFQDDLIPVCFVQIRGDTLLSSLQHWDLQKIPIFDMFAQDNLLHSVTEELQKNKYLTRRSSEISHWVTFRDWLPCTDSDLQFAL